MVRSGRAFDLQRPVAGRADKTMKMIVRKLIFALLFFCAGLAHAQLTIEITGAGANQIPIAITRFGGEDALTQSISEVIALPDVREAFLSNGAEPLGTSPQEMAQRMQSELIEWREVVRISGATVD